MIIEKSGLFPLSNNGFDDALTIIRSFCGLSIEFYESSITTWIHVLY